MTPRWAIRLLVALFAVFSVTGVAFGYWSAQTTATATGTVGTLAAPASVTVPGSPQATTSVPVSWSVSAAPHASAPVEYTVERSADAGSTWSAADSTCASPATSTSCQDTVPGAGTFAYRVTARWRSWSARSAASDPVVVAISTLHHFDVSAPASATAGSPVGVTVTAKDAANRTLTGYRGTVRLTSTDAKATLPADHAFTAADAGSRTFSGVRLETAGSQTISAADAARTGQAPVAVAPAAASKLVFSSQPADGTSGTALPAQPAVTIEDAFGNRRAADDTPVSLALTGPAGAVLSCTANPVGATAGRASFAGCNVDKAASGYRLTASATGLTPATSAAFAIAAGTAAKLAFTTQPSNGTGGTALATQPAVTVQDAAGNTVPGATPPVTLTLNGAGGGPLGCDLNPRDASSGVATFVGCKVDRAAPDYSLTATSVNLASATSAPFAITRGPAASLGFTSQPGGTSNADLPLGAQPAVTLYDAGGNVAASSATVTLSAATGAVVENCSVSASQGVAQFTVCRVKTAGDHAFTATTAALPPSRPSSTFTVGAGAATRLAFTRQPGGGVQGVAWAQQPIVTIQDAHGNAASTTMRTITLAKSAGGGSLTCPSVTTTSVATFSGCSINKSGTGYTLTATASGSPALSLTTSAGFDVTAK